MSDPLLGKNKLLRQALALAYDAASSIDLFYNGRAILAQGPIPLGFSGYDENYKNPYRQYNLAKAKELLAKAGYPDGNGLPELDYLTLSDSTSRQFSDFDEKQFAAIGVKIKIDSFSWPELVAAIKNHKGQLFAGSAWIADYPDAEDMLQVFYSKNGPPGPNDGSYSNPEFDKLYEKSLTLTDCPERTAIYKQMVDILAEDCPAIFMAQRIQYSMVQPWIKNFKLSRFDLGFARYLRIDESARK